MKLTKNQIKRIIKEEKAKILKETLEQVDYDNPNQSWGANDQDNQEEFQGSMMDLDDYNELVIQIERIVNIFEKKGYKQEDILHAIPAVLGEF